MVFSFLISVEIHGTTFLPHTQLSGRSTTESLLRFLTDVFAMRFPPRRRHVEWLCPHLYLPSSIDPPIISLKEIPHGTLPPSSSSKNLVYSPFSTSPNDIPCSQAQFNDCGRFTWG